MFQYKKPRKILTLGNVSFPGSWETGTGFSQLPGRGILRIYINNLVIKRVFVDKLLCILNISWENKKVCMVYHQDFFVFPWENKKVLVMLCLHTSRRSKITRTFLHSHGKTKSPGGVPSGLFCFPKFIQTLNDLIFISQWVININTGNEYFP